jgi:hypothetical protein
MWGIKFIPVTGLTNLNNIIPDKFYLKQNYPNPFNPVTKIEFQIPLSRGVSEGRGVLLVVYDMLGREVITLVNEKLKPGTYEVNWNAESFSSGTYFYRLVTDKITITKKMVLVK